MRCILEGLDCPSCAKKIETELRKVKGLTEVTVNFSTLTIDLPPELIDKAQTIIDQIEPEVKIIKPHQRVLSRQAEREAEKKQLYLILISGLLLAFGIIFGFATKDSSLLWIEYLTLLPAYLLVGWPVLLKAYRNITRGQLFDESFLMSVATIGAVVIGQFAEAVGVMLFYAIGEFLQERAVNRSRRSVQSLLKIKPDFANLKVAEEVKRVLPEEVRIDDQIVVKPGERVPLDGVILEGTSYMDTSALTGESVPRKVESGEKVLAGMINGQGMLLVRVAKLFEESSVARILKLVEEAAERKAPTEQFITVFAHYYTPLVVLTAIGVALLPPFFLPGASFGEWIYRALVLLVISCPCALMVSIPLGYFGGIGAASRKGILVKGANFLDALAKLKVVVFDKTGTLTKGVFRVNRIETANGFKQEELLAMAAAAESFSNHPIAQSIRTASSEPEITAQVSEYREIPGQGVSALVNGKQVYVGNDRLLHRQQIEHELCNIPGTTVHVVVDQVYAGYLVIADELKEDALLTVARLRNQGVERLVMLTGDEDTAARRVAEELRLNQYYGELLPEHKVEKVAELQETLNRKQAKLAFVGDGINDAPVLTRADIGVAMGAFGSDAAIEAADVVILKDSLVKVVEAIEIARNTRRIVWQNIAAALGVKAFFVVLGAAGVASIWEAVFADVGATLLAVLNATRTLHFGKGSK